MTREQGTTPRPGKSCFVACPPDQPCECRERIEREQGTTEPRWQVFSNPDRDRGGWWAYVEDGQHYLGGEWAPTKRAAEQAARRIAKASA